MDAYLWMKAFHVVSIIAWMAGLFYLPRLFVYHTQTTPGSEASEKFKVMEVKLLRVIMNPAMIASIITGLILIWQVFIDALATEGWLHAKLTLVVLMIGFHMMLARWRRAFAADTNSHSETFYRVVNEVPTVLMIAIVILVIVKPF